MEENIMPLVVPAVGEVALLNKLIVNLLSSDERYILKLYKNNYSPIETATQASFTEANFTSYAARTLSRAGWYAGVHGTPKAECSYAGVQSWTCGTTGNTIYGYWVVGDTKNAGTVLWAELFSTARVLATNDVLNITPKFTLQSEYS
jgi:hypothetical protein